MLSETSIPRKSARHNSNRGQQPHYDMSWHPADEQIRPQAAAARRKRQKVSEKEDDEGKVGICAASPVNERPIDQDIVDPRPENTAPEMSRVWPDDGCRRSARAKTCDAPPLYSARYHPADAILRPAAAAKYLSTRPQPVSPSKQIQSPPAESSSRRLTATQVKTKHSGQFSFPLPNPVTEATDFQRLPKIDRRMLQLQKCVPVGARIVMPDTWEHIRDVLHNEALISQDQASSEQIVELIKTRYESARSAVTAYFKSALEPGDKKDWVLLRAENFDVFDLGRGQKFWPRHPRSIVSAIRGAPVQQLSATNAGAAKPAGMELLDGETTGPFFTVADPRPITSPSTILTGEQAAEQTLTGVYDPMMSQSEHHFLSERADYAKRSTVSPFANGNEEDTRFASRSPSITSREGSPQASIRNIIDTRFEDDGDVADAVRTSLEYLATDATARRSSVKVLINENVPPQYYAQRVRPSEDRQRQTRKSVTIGRHSRQYETRHNLAESITIAEDAPGISPKIKHLVESFPLSHGSDIPKENLASQERLEASHSPSSRGSRARNRYRSSNFGDVNRQY